MSFTTEFLKSTERQSRKHIKNGDSVPKALAKGAGETAGAVLLTVVIGLLIFGGLLMGMMS